MHIGRFRCWSSKLTMTSGVRSETHCENISPTEFSSVFSREILIICAWNNWNPSTFEHHHETARRGRPRLSPSAFIELSQQHAGMGWWLIHGSLIRECYYEFTFESCWCWLSKGSWMLLSWLGGDWSMGVWFDNVIMNLYFSEVKI